MPGKTTKKRAAKDKREGKSASTQAGEYVHEEMEHVREGKHGGVRPSRPSRSACPRPAAPG